MPRCLLFLGFLLVSACGRSEQDNAVAALNAEAIEMQNRHAAWASSQPRPSPQLVDKIEAMLSRHACFGDLNRWERTYAYDGKGMDIRYDHIVALRLREAGRFGIESGRHFTEPYSWVSIDDTPVRIAWGDYDTTDDQIRIAFCDQNVGSQADAGPINTYFDDLDRRRLRRPGVAGR